MCAACTATEAWAVGDECNTGLHTEAADTGKLTCGVKRGSLMLL